MLPALGFFALLEVVGLAAAPLTALVFARMPGAGLGFAKPFGLLLVGWLVWMAGSLHAVPYGRGAIAGAFVIVALAGAAAAARPRGARRRRGRRASGGCGGGWGRRASGRGRCAAGGWRGWRRARYRPRTPSAGG